MNFKQQKYYYKQDNGGWLLVKVISLFFIFATIGCLLENKHDQRHTYLMKGVIYVTGTTAFNA